MLIDTGRYDLAPYREYAERFAEFFGLRLEEVPGTTRLVDMLVAGEWDDAFLVVPPGHEITLDDFHAAGTALCEARRRRAADDQCGGSRPVKMLCIGGFLGSGKTTLLLRIARSLMKSSFSVAVVENEIGEIGIDGGYLREHGLPVEDAVRTAATAWPGAGCLSRAAAPGAEG